MVSALSMPPSYRVHQKTIATASTVQRTLSSPRMAPKDTPTNTSILLPGMEESFPRKYNNYHYNNSCVNIHNRFYICTIYILVV